MCAVLRELEALAIALNEPLPTGEHFGHTPNDDWDYRHRTCFRLPADQQWRKRDKKLKKREVQKMEKWGMSGSLNLKTKRRTN